MNTKYPYETLGAIMINNWVENFFLEMTFILYVLGIPLIVDIIFLIISTIKIKKLRKQGSNMMKDRDGVFSYMLNWDRVLF